MKKFTLILLFIVVTKITQAQKPIKFDDLIEVANNGAIKIYLDAVFKISYERCADYYMIADFNKEYFQFQDTLKIYYNTDELFLEGRYENGKRNGKFIWYHKNGKIQTIGEYTFGKRSGIWEYFYSNGAPHKKIEFKNDKEHLIDLFGKRGKVKVKNGKGVFDDDVLMSISSTSTNNVKGEVVNGLPNGKWQIYTSRIKIGTEYFENNSFVKGLSHSLVLQDYEYHNQYVSTFTGIVYVEHLRIFSPAMCRQKASFGLTKSFYNDLKEKYASSNLNNTISNNWFLIEVATDGSNNIVNVEIFSYAKQEFSDQLKKLVFEIGKLKPILASTGAVSKHHFFPLVLYNNEMYLPDDEKIELLKHKF